MGIKRLGELRDWEIGWLANLASGQENLKVFSTQLSGCLCSTLRYLVIFWGAISGYPLYLFCFSTLSPVQEKQKRMPLLSGARAAQ